MAEQFVKGLYAKAKHPKAPTYVVCGLSAKRDELIEFLQGQEGEWVNMQIKVSRNGEKLYVAVDNYKKAEDGGYHAPEVQPEKSQDEEDTIEYPEDDTIDPNSIPF